MPNSDGDALRALPVDGRLTSRMCRNQDGAEGARPPERPAALKIQHIFDHPSLM